MTKSEFRMGSSGENIIIPLKDYHLLVEKNRECEAYKIAYANHALTTALESVCRSSELISNINGPQFAQLLRRRSTELIQNTFKLMRSNIIEKDKP